MASTTGDQFEAYFKRADLDGDGRISGPEAVSFFQASGLTKSVLAKVWTYADQKQVGFLGREEFFNALKLVTVAQSKRELTPDIVKAALYTPASAKIPPPQINLAALPPPRAVVLGAAPVASQMSLAASLTPQSNATGTPQQWPGNAAGNQQYFPSQQNQVIRPSQATPPTVVLQPQQVVAGQPMPTGSPAAASRPPSSNVPNNWFVGVTSGLTSQTSNRGISPVSQDGPGMTASGFTSPVQARPPQVATGQVASFPPETHKAAMASIRPATTDSKLAGVSGNGSATDSLFADVFSSTAAQNQQGSSAAVASTTASIIPASSAIVPPAARHQPSVKPGPVGSIQGKMSPQSGVGQTTVRQNQQVAAQSTTVPPTSGFPATSQSQTSWPRMSQSDIQKYMKVFVQVDTDRDGKITGEETRNLFLSWKLPREVLKQVWDLSDQDNDSMLSLREFCIALYLMERFREGRPLPATLPSSVMSDETLLSATSHPTASFGRGSWGPASGVRQSQVMPSSRPTPAGAAKPPRPRPASHADEKPPAQQKPKVAVLEKHLVDQLSQEEQDALNAKFQEASHADKKVEELEKEIIESRQKIEFYSAKMQELIIYKSRCDNRLNEVTAWVSVDKREAELLAKKYEEKYKQSGDVASKLTIEEATFRDIQEKKMELYRAILKMEDGGRADVVLKERAEHIQSGLEDLVKSVNERCKQYGLRAKPTSLVELPFGWQPGIQEGAADWDEDWDKFEDEGFTFVKELTLDVQNVVVPPKPKVSIRKETTVKGGDQSPEVKSNIASPHESITARESAHEQSENPVASPSESPSKSVSESQAHEFRDSPLRENTGADSSPRSNVGGAESVFSGDKSVDAVGWGKFDTHYDTDSVWSFDSKDMDGGNSLLSFGEFSLNPVKTGASLGKSPLFDSVPSTPAYDQGRISFGFGDSVPSTPGYNPGKTSVFADSVPSTPAYNNHGKGSYAFADSVPSTPAYNLGQSSGAFADSVPSTPAYDFGRFGEGPEDHSFDSFSRFDSFGTHDGGLFQSQGRSLARFDSISSTRESDHGYAFPSRFDSFSESRDSEDRGFSRFSSFKDTEPGQGLSRFDSFKDSEIGRFDSFREHKDNDHSRGFSRFDSFNSQDGGSFQYPGESLSRFDSASGSKDTAHGHGFSSFDDADPFGSGGPFRSSRDSETLRKSTDTWRAF